MAPSDMLLVVLASAAGFALMGAALVVIEGMHLWQSGRYFTGLGWLGTAASGAYLAIVPGYTHTPLPWYVVMVTVTAAIVFWQNIEALCAEAKRQARHRWMAPVAVVGLLAGCVAIAQAQGAELVGKVINLSDDEADVCRTTGCVLVDKDAMQRLLRAAANCRPGV